MTAGECTLRIGDGYVFGEDGLRPRTERDDVDLYCQDIRYSASFHCPHGAAAALAPMTAVGLPASAEGAAALLRDAPARLAAGDLQLAPRPMPMHAGIGIVRSRAGATYKLWLVETGDHPDALERTARIRFAPVPAVDGGGALQLPQTLGAPSAETLQAIRTAVDIGARIPGQNFHTYLEGPFTASAAPSADLVLGETKSVVFERLSTQNVALAERGAVFTQRFGRDASLVLRGGGAAGVAHDLEGLLRTEGYSYVYVGGDLTGTLDVDSYTTAAILGDVRGKIRLRSYTDLYVRGRILGTLDIQGSGWCTFYLQTFHSRSEIERLAGSDQITVHVMRSDLPAGEHTGVGKWRQVIVGDPLWQKLAR